MCVISSHFPPHLNIFLLRHISHSSNTEISLKSLNLVLATLPLVVRAVPSVLDRSLLLLLLYACAGFAEAVRNDENRKKECHDAEYHRVDLVDLVIIHPVDGARSAGRLYSVSTGQVRIIQFNSVSRIPLSSL